MRQESSLTLSAPLPAVHDGDLRLLALHSYLIVLALLAFAD